jgi:hypothetical protein
MRDEGKKGGIGKTLLVLGIGALIGYALGSSSKDKKIKQGAGRPDKRYEQD